MDGLGVNIFGKLMGPRLFYSNGVFTIFWDLLVILELQPGVEVTRVTLRLISRESIRPRATCGLSQSPSGRFWISADVFPTSTCPMRKWCRACGNCIMPLTAATPIPKTVARRILETASITYRGQPPPPRTSTIWCSSAGNERRPRDRLSVKYRSFCSGKILDTLQHPDIEPRISTSTTFLIVIPRDRTSLFLKRNDGCAMTVNVLIRRTARTSE